MTIRHLTLGPLEPPIADQLAGLNIPPEVLERWQCMADAITLLHLRGILSDTACMICRKNLMRKVKKVFI